MTKRELPEAVRESLVMLTVSDLCDLLNVHKDWIYDECAKSRIPHVRLGRKILFRPAEIHQWISGQMSTPGTP
jgi:excisionase family DNA binding protein